MSQPNQIKIIINKKLIWVVELNINQPQKVSTIQSKHPGKHKDPCLEYIGKHFDHLSFDSTGYTSYNL